MRITNGRVITSFHYVVLFFLVWHSGMFLSPAWSSTSTWSSAYCSYCWSDNQFASFAENHVPNTFLGNGGVLTYPVYVINPNTLQQRYFDVHVWWGGGTINSAPEAEEENGPSARSGSAQSSQGLQKLAVLGAGNPMVVEAIEESVLMVDAFFQSTRIIDSTDLNTEVDSAIDLVGPDTSQAGEDRTSLPLQVADYLEANWDTIFGQGSDLLDRAVDNYIGESQVFRDQLFQVNFPDGTSAKFVISYGSNNPVMLVMELLEDTLTMPDGTAVPSFPEHLIGEHEVSLGMGDSLMDLVNRFRNSSPPLSDVNCSMICEQPSSGSTLTCTLTCPIP